MRTFLVWILFFSFFDFVGGSLAHADEVQGNSQQVTSSENKVARLIDKVGTVKGTVHPMYFFNILEGQDVIVHSYKLLTRQEKRRLGNDPKTVVKGKFFFVAEDGKEAILKVYGRYFNVQSTIDLLAFKNHAQVELTGTLRMLTDADRRYAGVRFDAISCQTVENPGKEEFEITGTIRQGHHGLMLETKGGLLGLLNIE